QVITATHSSEVLAEVPAESVVWVSRSRKNSVRAPGPELMGEISGVLGTGFNLRLARALRARLVVFVEGDDTKVLRELATVAGAEAISAEREVVVIPLKGFDRWRGVEVFAWVLQDFLEGSVPTWVFLDRDVRDDKTVEEIESALKKAGANPHVWQKHELENYLVVSSPISRASGAPVGFVDDAIDEALEELKEPLRARYTNELMAGRGKLKDPGKAAIAANKRLERVWTSRAKRVDAVPGKELLAGVRRRLQDAGHEAVGDRSLAREFRAKEIAPELFEALATLEKQL
ncbi:MAG: hypothetical protein U0R24_09960, partial [Solirubrobacterales bacterium]